MTELIPVEGHTSLGRDPNSNAIVNTDNSGYEAYKKAREEARRKRPFFERTTRRGCRTQAVSEKT